MHLWPPPPPGYGLGADHTVQISRLIRGRARHILVCSSADLCSVPWLVDSIRRLVIMLFRFGVFPTGVLTPFFLGGGLPM